MLSYFIQLIKLISLKNLVTLTLMKFIPLSRATAPANSVFPVPGAPYSKTPDLCRMGRFANNSGYWKRMSTRHVLK